MKSSRENPVLRFSVPYVTGDEIEYIKDVIASKNFAGNGPYTKKAQALIESRIGVRKVLLTHSCTAALEMSALLLDVGPGDEVIMPSYTFCSTASAFARTGCTIAFCDIDPATMMADPADIERRITPNTKAIVPVHYGGLACQIEEIAALAQRHEIALVEDAAQGFDAAVNGRPLGTFGTFGCISFHETKNLHAGLCGALYVNEDDPELQERAIRIWERGTNRQAVLKGVIDKYSWTDLGSSFYPSELQAAFLLAQLEHADKNKRERQTLYARYANPLRALADKGAFTFPPMPQSLDTNYHACYVIFDSIADCDRVRETLKRAGINAYIGYVPLHSSPMGLKLGNKPDDVPITEALAPRTLRLPFHNDMTEADVDRVVDLMRQCFADHHAHV